MVERGVYPGDINTPDGLTKRLSIVNLGNLLDWNMFRIATEERKKEIRRKYLLLRSSLRIEKQFRGKRIWTLTCAARREWGFVGKLLNFLFPIIHSFAQIEFARKPILKGGKLKLGCPNVFTLSKR